MLLTDGAGAKRQLAILMGLSAANISHRLKGLKSLDDSETEKIAQAVGLEPSWFDTPQSEVPDAVLKRLNTPTGPLGAPVAQRATEGKKKATQAQGLQALSAEQLASSQLATGLVAPQEKPVIKTSVAPAKKAQAKEPAASTPAKATKPTATATAQPERAAAPNVSVPASVRAPSLVEPAVTAQAAPAATQAPTPAPVPASSAAAEREAALAAMEDAAPIATALLKVMRAKIAQGRLDEMRAAAMLQEIAGL